MQIIPAILTNDIEEFKNLLVRISDAKKFDRVQVDFVDGMFANNKTIIPSDCNLPKYPSFKFDAHLMVTIDNVVNYSQLAQEQGFDRIFVHAESVLNQVEYEYLAIDLSADIGSFNENFVDNKRAILLMSVKAGFSNQKFKEEVTKKINWFSFYRKEESLNFNIILDGGIEKEQLISLENLGVDEVVVGANRVLSW